jgi:Magnesium chelatase, subunit ChlI
MYYLWGHLERENITRTRYVRHPSRNEHRRSSGCNANLFCGRSTSRGHTADPASPIPRAASHDFACRPSGWRKYPKPGEISLAHRGVLFLYEFPEFGTRVLEVMRQPMEDKVVTISRAKGSLTFSANFQLIAAMNPCPGGYYGDTQKPCTCAYALVTKYQKRISGPLLDRIDTAQPHRSTKSGLRKVECRPSWGIVQVHPCTRAGRA